MSGETVIDIGTVIERQQTTRFGVLLIVAMGVMMMT